MFQRMHRKSLEIVFDSDEDYNELRQQNNDISLLQRDLCILLCEVFNALNIS